MKEMLTFNFGVSTIVSPGTSVSSLFWSRMAKFGDLDHDEHVRVDRDRGVARHLRRLETTRGNVDKGSMGASMVLYAMPEFVLGMIFILIFASALHWFPVEPIRERDPR